MLFIHWSHDGFFYFRTFNPQTSTCYIILKRFNSFLYLLSNIMSTFLNCFNKIAHGIKLTFLSPLKIMNFELMDPTDLHNRPHHGINLYEKLQMVNVKVTSGVSAYSFFHNLVCSTTSDHNITVACSKSYFCMRWC